MIVNNELRIDFIGIGTGKSGTTWLAEILRQHPDIYYPAKRKEKNCQSDRGSSQAHGE